MTDALLDARGICKFFGGVRAVDDVSLSIPRGGIYAVIGPNGAGKTTFFNTLSGFAKPDGGTVTFEGVEVTTEVDWRRIRRGMSRTFQTPSIFPELTAAENVMMGVRSARNLAFRFGVPGKAERERCEERVGELLGFVGLRASAQRPMTELSHGSQRLVEIAMSLSTDPKLVLLDEPMAGLAEAEADRVSGVINELHDRLGLTVLFVEHNMRIVLSLAQRITVLDRGKLLAEGSPAEISANAAVREAYLGSEVIAHV
jgi:branched-chain amino acid transport system ATP-binding protein